ncbi:clostripain-related cysteine peptidase [Desulfurobacterium sp.]
MKTLKNFSTVVFVLIFSFAFFVSCGYREDNSSSWIFAVYMAGDNNLSSYVTYDLGEMMAAGSDSNVRVLVLCDRGAGTTLYEVRKGWLKPVKVFGNLDTGNPATLKLFIEEIKNRFSFKKAAIVLWDHGDGWEDAAFDNTASSALKMADIKKVFNDTDFHPEFLGFDECLAGMAEVFYTFKDIANITVASEASEPGYGWEYASLINSLKKHPEWKGEDLGKAAVDVYYQFYSNRTDYCQPECTLASVSSENASAIAAAVNLFASRAINGTSALLQDISSARDNTTEPESYYFPFYADLYSFADKINETVADPGIKDAAVAIMDAVRGIYFKSTGSELNGVSIYFPDSREEYFEDYFNTTLNDFSATLWDDFLIDYYGVLP